MDADFARLADPLRGAPRIVAALIALGFTAMLMQTAFPIG